MELDNNQLVEDFKLTKHFKLLKDFPPLYTGGSFAVLKNERHCFSLKESKICVFDLQTQTLLTTLSQENEEVLCFAISPNQQYIAISNKSYMIRVFAMSSEQDDYKTIEQVQQFKTTGQMILEMAFDPSSKFLAAGSADSQIKVYDVIKGFQTHNFIGHRGIITNLSFFPDNDTLMIISTAEDCQIKVWDMVMKQEVANLRGHSALVTSLIFTQDKTTMISSSKDGKIGFWNAKNKFQQIALFKYAPHEDELNALYFFTYDEKPFLVVGTASGALSIFDINQKRICFEQKDVVSKNEITKLIHLQKSNKLLCLNADQQLTIYSFKKSKKSQSVKLIPEHLNCLYLDEIIDVKILKKTEEGQPKEAVICSNNELIKLINLETGEVAQSPGHTDIILCLDVNNEWIVSGSKDNQIRLWNYNEEANFDQRLKCIACFSGHNENIASVSFAPRKGNFFVSASQDNTIKVWDVQKLKSEEFTGEVEEVKSANMTVMGHQKYINMVKVSPNDKLIASASQDKSIKLWQSRDLMLVTTLNGHKKGVWDIAFSPVDKILISASGDKTIKVWNLNNSQCIATLQGHQQSLVKLSWINAGLQILSASVDGIIKIWNLKKQQCVNTFQMHDEKIWGLDITTSDRYLLTGGGDSTLKLWVDCTKEKELEDKENQLKKLQEEQQLSNLIRNQDFTEAALLAFRLNRLRDFYLVLNKLIQPKQILDPVDAVLNDRQKFNNFLNNLSTQSQKNENQAQLNSIIDQLLQQDKKRLFNIIRNLNSKNEYSNLANHLLQVILPKFKAYEYSESQSELKELKEIFDVMSFYCDKHLERTEKNLKKAYYPEYILTQMSIEEDKDLIKKEQDEDKSEKELTKNVWKENKKKNSSSIKKTQIKLKQKKRTFSDNLFEDTNEEGQKGGLQKRLKH